MRSTARLACYPSIQTPFAVHCLARMFEHNKTAVCWDGRCLNGWSAVQGNAVEGEELSHEAYSTGELRTAHGMCLLR
jgi:hypothetical protein